MKTITMKTMLLALAFLPLMAFAQYQSPIESLYTKYAGQDNFTSVNITKELFQMLMKIEVDGKGTEDIKEMQNMLTQIDGLKILTYTDTADYSKASSLYKEFNALFPASAYKELMSIRENGDDIRFLTKEDESGKILELVMLQQEKGEAMVLSLSGHIDMSTVSQISKNMKIQGMENLEKVKEHHSKDKD